MIVGLSLSLAVAVHLTCTVTSSMSERISFSKSRARCFSCAVVRAAGAPTGVTRPTGPCDGERGAPLLKPDPTPDDVSSVNVPDKGDMTGEPPGERGPEPTWSRLVLVPIVNRERRELPACISALRRLCHAASRACTTGVASMSAADGRRDGFACDIPQGRRAFRARATLPSPGCASPA